MRELNDMALLQEYVRNNFEEAFATLVRRPVNKVYSIALRHTRKPNQAEEITQTVFVILARKSRDLSKSVILSGWLCRTAQLTAVTFIRSEIRRARREQEASMQTLSNEGESDVWSQIAPLLDGAMARLSGPESPGANPLLYAIGVMGERRLSLLSRRNYIHSRASWSKASG